MSGPADAPSPVPPAAPVIGVIVVAYASEDVILTCVESVLAHATPGLRLAVVDNASPDGTVAALRDWAAGRRAAEGWPQGLAPARPLPRPLPLTEIAAGEAPPPGAAPLLLVRNPVNAGYAGGVNAGLAALAAFAEVDAFWILNPDGLAGPGTAAAFAAAAARHPGFGLMTGRVRYAESPRAIQSDGGRVNRLTGICESVNLGRDGEATPLPDPAGLDYVSGASLVASRRFLEAAGPMTEDYFLYYEEVDWAARRGALPIVGAPGAVVHHHGGTAIGTASLTRLASGFSNWFNYRNRMRFMRRFHARAAPLAYLYSLAKVARLLTQGAWEPAAGAFAGLHGLPPPKSVRARLSPEALARATRRAD